MTGDATTWMWSIGLITFAFGIAAGYAISFFFNNDHAKARRLEEELERLQSEHAGYRGQVAEHFQRTSELVQEMTDSYRNVYEHLATGSQQLCSDAIQTPQLDLPATERLPGQAAATSTEDTTPAAKVAETDTPKTSESPVPPADANVAEQPSAPETPSSNDYLGDAPYVPDLDLRNVSEEDTPKPTDQAKAS